ncbi:Mitoferrin [Galdieria sulphuraria]|nr:Mitoferrin [Galdieria sulphuraria]
MVSDEKGNIPLSFIPHIEEVASTDLSHWQHMIAGAVAGLTETTLMFPLDTVKTRLQSITVNTPNQGLFSCVAEILRKEGFLKLWRGIGAASMTAGPGHAVYFATYEIGKQLFSNNVNEYKPLATAGAGCNCRRLQPVSFP